MLKRGCALVQEILPEFFRNFWVRRMALDRRNYRQLVDSTVVIARKTGCSEIVGRIVEDLKDESEPYRRMVMETIDKVRIFLLHAVAEAGPLSINCTAHSNSMHSVSTCRGSAVALGSCMPRHPADLASLWPTHLRY